MAHELAGQEGFESVRASDEKHTAPGAEVLRKLIGDSPTLIILDEISGYLRKAEQVQPGPAKQFTAFIHALFGEREAALNEVNLPQELPADFRTFEHTVKSNEVRPGCFIACDCKILH